MKIDKPGPVIAALSDFAQFRDLISEFLEQLEDVPASIIRHCEKNGWNDSVAFTIRDAGFKLGVALSVLDRWAKDADIPQEIIDVVEAENRKKED